MASSEMECDVAIVGGGLAGLTAAHLLDDAGADVLVLEAADRFGGRIHSLYDTENNNYAADLGPTWVWPPYQPIVARWLERLQVETFSQYETGNAVLDLQSDTPPSRQFLPGQHGIARLSGGPQALIDALLSSLPRSKCRTGHGIAALSSDGKRLILNPADELQPRILARRVVIAAPLRLMAEAVDWNGLIDVPTLEIMRNAPTWMASQAKVSVVYESAFWRDQGLSGRVASHIGPMVEVHDHSGANGSPAALFGFIGWPPQQRRDYDLRAAVISQLVRCFGEQARSFQQLEVKDWAQDAHICSKRDLSTPPEHPVQLPAKIRDGHCDNRLFFAVAETATQSPGLIDGALESGERATMQILSAI